MSKKVGLNESRTLKTTCTKPFQMGVTSSQFGLADAGRNSAGLTGSHREIHQHELWTVLWSQKWRASRHHVCRGRIPLVAYSIFVGKGLHLNPCTFDIIWLFCSQDWFCQGLPIAWFTAVCAWTTLMPNCKTLRSRICRLWPSWRTLKALTWQ